jgi:heat shock protein HslJ
MKPFYGYFSVSMVIGLLVISVLVTGCTSQPAPVQSVPPLTTTAPAQTTATSPVVLPDTLTSTTWQLRWFDDNNGGWSSVGEGSTVFATFISESAITGSGGCNGYTSKYQIGNESRIQIMRPVVTDRLCQTPVGVMSQESVYFTDLGRAATYSITNGQLLIFDTANKKILQFDPS